MACQTFSQVLCEQARNGSTFMTVQSNQEPDDMQSYLDKYNTILSILFKGEVNIAVEIH